MRSLFRRSGWLAAACAVMAAGCGDDPPAPEPRSRSERKKKGTSEALQEKLAARILDDLNNLVDDAHVKLVWIDQRGKHGLDPFGGETNYRIVGFDNREGGFRVIAVRKNSYFRPLMTPDGSAVVFTQRSRDDHGPGAGDSPASGKAAPEGSNDASTIQVVPWKGGKPTMLAEGFAVAVWRDPATATDWVYAIESHIPKRASRASHQKVFRFQLRDPSRREVAWQGTPMSIDNFHISRDGRVFAALFPWPNAGVGEFSEKRWRKLDNGCWPALAPDNSRVAWVFDGAHKRVRLFDADGARLSDLDLSAAPGMERHAAYHPRWTNHPRFIVMTGPYPSKKRGRGQLEQGARHAEVHLGKVKADLSGFEGWVRLTSNSAGDFYPDAWIESGSEAVLAEFPQHVGVPATRSPVSEWPRVSRGAAFAWENSKAANQPRDRGTACAVTARGQARPGRFHDLLLDGGWFEIDEDSSAAWTKGVRKSRAFTVGCLVTEHGDGTLPAAGVSLLACRDASGRGALVVRRTPTGCRAQLLLAAENRSNTAWADDLESAAFTAEQPVALALTWKDGQLHWFINGALVRSSEPGPAGPLAIADNAIITFGDPATKWPDRWWSAEKLILATEAHTPDEITAEATAALAAARHPALEPLRVRARVLAATPAEPDRLDVYKRMLVDHVYQITETLSGPPAVSPRISVLHWAILDEKSVPGMPREEGSQVELLLHPANTHPELESELTVTGDVNFDLPVYYDIAPPPRP